MNICTQGPPANLALLLPQDRCKRSKHQQRCSVSSCPSSSPSLRRQQLYPHSPPPACMPPCPPNNTNAASPAPCALVPAPTVAWPSQQAPLLESDEREEPMRGGQQLMAVPLSHAQEQNLPAAAAPPHFRFVSSGEAKMAQVQLLQQRAAQLATTSSTGAEWSEEEDATDACESPPSSSFQTAPSAPLLQRSGVQGYGEHAQLVWRGLGPEAKPASPSGLNTGEGGDGEMQVDPVAEKCGSEAGTAPPAGALHLVEIDRDVSKNGLRENHKAFSGKVGTPQAPSAALQAEEYTAQLQQPEAKPLQQVQEQPEQQAAVPVGTAAVLAHRSGPRTEGNGHDLHATAAEASIPSAEAATPLLGFSIPSREANPPSPTDSTPSPEAFTPPAAFSFPSAATATPSLPSPTTNPPPAVAPPPQMVPSKPVVAALQRAQADSTVAPSMPVVASLHRAQAESTVQAGGSQQHAGAQQGYDRNGERRGSSAAGRERKSGGLLGRLFSPWGSHGPRQQHLQQQQQRQQQHSSQQNVIKREREDEGEEGYGVERRVRARAPELEDVANADKEKAKDGAIDLMCGAGPSDPEGGENSNAHTGGVVAAGLEAVLHNNAHARGAVAAGPEAVLHSNVLTDGVVAAGPGSSALSGQASLECARLLQLVSRLAAQLGQPQPGGELAVRLSMALDSHAAKVSPAGQEESWRVEPEACRAASYKRLEGIIRSSFYMARARQQQRQQQQPGPACGLAQLVSSTIDVDRWCSVGLPPPRPLPASQGSVAIVRIAASAMEQLLQGCGCAPASPCSLPDFDRLLKTCSQVVQAIGEDGALGRGAPPSLLHSLLLQVYGSGEAHSGASLEQRTVQALVASVEPAQGIFRSIEEFESSK
ncbi:hypothetical protein DUNSADRAFT_16977 [Dunaliella salina]|uniref:Uncharacterized protein n=1 Tax=Dunaliella salina TaxID=3046 RepID=A0ABQ7G2N6_DUNSA|nr:hypothetical protein DUNSADRAFT_16977 [Dunaliella salina]|eukprot:KAF5828858.1 hypothetical protein DUNSADRAFT_16977 [Dunaliella salina]